MLPNVTGSGWLRGMQWPGPQHRVPTTLFVGFTLLLQGTPEENAAHFFKVAKELRYADL